MTKIQQGSHMAAHQVFTWMQLQTLLRERRRNFSPVAVDAQRGGK
jgi:hypothetical protein